MPAVHAVADKLPAVSGSSGRLVVERRSKKLQANRVWPGQVFADPNLCYSEAMQRFACASHQRFEQRKYQRSGATAQADPRRPIRAEAAAVRAARRNVRTARQQEDEAWSTLWNTRQAVLEARRRAGGAQAWTDDADDLQWRALRQQRHRTLMQRQTEDSQWRSEHNALRQALADEMLPTQWHAVLLVTDNSTRQCYELPVFASGGRVTAAEVEAAFEGMLPHNIKYVISDQGTHFMAKTFQQLAQRSGFVHVPIARHRPQSNGIVERCVRTLKEWLADKVWSSEAELRVLLEVFRVDYNDGPHQGLGIPGLSPNELAQRIWLL